MAPIAAEIVNPTWGRFVFLAALCIYRLYLGLTLRPPRNADDDPRPHLFQTIAKRTGLFIGIGAGIAALRMLLALLK
jgi:hypothetical protein